MPRQRRCRHARPVAEDLTDQRAGSIGDQVGVKRLLARQFARDDWSTPGPSDQGWSAVEDTLKLSGWDRARRIVVLAGSLKRIWR